MSLSRLIVEGQECDFGAAGGLAKILSLQVDMQMEDRSGNLRFSAIQNGLMTNMTKRERQ